MILDSRNRIRGLIILIAILFSLSVEAQKSWTEKYSINTSFELGQIKSYKVSELFKIDNLIFGVRYKVNSVVTFHIVDTIDGGYLINYKVKTNSIKQSTDSFDLIVSKLLNDLDLYLFAINGQVQLDTTTYFINKKRVEKELMAILEKEAVGKNYKKQLEDLSNSLKKDAGLGYFLSPLILFMEYYSSMDYKKFRIAKDGQSKDILNKMLFRGHIYQEWLKTTKGNLVKLNRYYVGHPVNAAAYYKSIYEPILVAKNIRKGKNFWPPEMIYKSDDMFYVRDGDTFPKSLYKKVVSEYIFRSVMKIEMLEI